jgi:methionine-rich copper-binding protein CopC
MRNRSSLGAVALMALALAVGALLVSASTVSAHARRESSTPGTSEVVATSPPSVEIIFTQEIQRISGTYGIDVTDEAGADVTAGDAVIDDIDRTKMSVALQPNLPDGRYVVMFRNVSDADGDAFEAGFAFYVGVEPTDEQLAEDALLEPPEVSATQTFEAGGETPSGTPPPSSSPGATPDPPVNGDDDGGGSNTAVIVIVVIAAAAVGIALGFAAYRFLRSSG